MKGWEKVVAHRNEPSWAVCAPCCGALARIYTHWHRLGTIQLCGRCGATWMRLKRGGDDLVLRAFLKEHGEWR